MGHEHVRLLDQLRPGHPVPAQQQVHRHRRGGDVADQQRLEAEKAGELLIPAGRWIVAVDQPVR
jgi:hypothetical protein